MIDAMTIATAPGKIILAGEHAVVYGRPAIAVPVCQVRATAVVENAPVGSGCTIIAPDVGLRLRLAASTDEQPLALITRLALQQLARPPDPDWQITVHSMIPIASGLGSGAALSAALVRAIYQHAGQPIRPEQVSALVYESERHYHGTPSGIDNTVIAYGQPIWFVKGEPLVAFTPRHPFTLVIAHSGISAPTKEAVSDVRRGWQVDPVRYEALFDRIGAIVYATRQAIAQGDWGTLGRLFDQNQRVLEEIGVSSPVLEKLLVAARAAGALGAKLSGGGRGGNIIALVEAGAQENVRLALLAAGAKGVIVTRVGE